MLIVLGSDKFFSIIFIFFLFFPFFIEETTSNQAGLQDSMKKQIACCENSSNYWTKFSKPCPAATSCYQTASITTGTTQRGHNSSDNDTVGTGSSNLQRHLSVSEPTEAWATLQGSISFWTNWSMSNPARKHQFLNQLKHEQPCKEEAEQWIQHTQILESRSLRYKPNKCCMSVVKYNDVL
jgi:hypothetical protein